MKKIWKSGKLVYKYWKSGKLVQKNLEICESGNLEIEPALYVAVEVCVSRFPNLFHLAFQISRFVGLALQISRMNLVKQPRNQPGNNSSGILLW